ncbi:MAG: LPS export ABC transporter permease LptF [Legionellales bacterium RIFCSPHIGHO2_12_FULL_42_9]|nr:MAG: LPS export ABC transporter permease LptF [Legionellales bacterium RIFCSPHIGHO2_12_FULL_42_9]
MLIFRYLAKEVLLTLAALTAILLLIFMSNEFVLYLNRAALGRIPGVILMKLMVLELPMLLGPLLPLGFYVALLLVYGRLYAESEMVVLQAAGFGSNQLLKHSLIMASIVALLLALTVSLGGPLVAQKRNQLLGETGVQVLIQTVAPGRFQALSEGKQVFYIETMNRSHDEANHIFWARQAIKKDHPQWTILWAERGFTQNDKKTGENFIVLQNGHEYQGLPGESNYQIAQFYQYKARLPHPNFRFKEDIREVKTSQLLPYFNLDMRKFAELQWRLSLVLMVFPLTLIAVPLSRVSPRSGKFAKLFPAICIFFIYANLIFVVRDALSDGKIPQWLGIWWVHGLAALLGLGLILHNRAKLL